jgi:hypothetical protein
MTRDGSGFGVLVRTSVALTVAAVLAGSAPAVAGDLRHARRALAEVAAAIETRAAELASAREALTAADARVDAVAGRLAAVTVVRARVAERIAAADARLAAAQAELDELAAGLFMDAASDAGSLVTAVLGARSIPELGDRIEYASSSSHDAAGVAAQAQSARDELTRRQAAADVLVAAEAVLLGSVRAARDDQALAVERTRRAVEDLEAERESAVALVDRLAAEAGGVAALDLTGLRRALHGADSVTYGQWAQLFLDVAGAPVCRANLVIMIAWQAAEGTEAAWNPLATTRPMPGSTDFNSVGVQDFVSLRQGLAGTWETIENGWDVYRYGAIVGSLRRCAPAMATARAINASSWCPGCTNGMYVLNVVPHVEDNLDTYLEL